MGSRGALVPKPPLSRRRRFRSTIGFGASADSHSQFVLEFGDRDPPAEVRVDVVGEVRGDDAAGVNWTPAPSSPIGTVTFSVGTYASAALALEQLREVGEVGG